MKRQFLILSLLVALGTIAVGYNACTQVQFDQLHKLHGTNVGNPLTPTQATQEILFAICSVLDRCQGQVPFNVCMSGIASVNGIGSRLGLAPGIDDPFSTLQSAEGSGSLTANAVQTNTCVDSINNLSCVDANVLNAYVATNTEPFAAVPYMVPIAACGQVFTPPVQTYACTTQVFLRGGANSSNGPAVTAAGLNYSVSPALPAGLNINPVTGVVAGTPTVITPMTAYTISATGPLGVTTATLNIETNDGYLVNDLGDSPNTGGTACSTTTGTCTLRAAVAAAASSGKTKAIVTPPGVINLTSATPLNITQGLEIHGDCVKGTTIDGIQKTQVLSINAGPTVLEHLTVQNGLLNNQPGAGISISTSSVGFLTTLQNIVVQNNKISAGNSGSADGAGISIFGTSAAVQATVNLIDSTVSGNINNSTGGDFGGGIAFYNFAQGSMVNCTVSGNQSASHGAGISVRGSTVSVTQSLIYNNSNGASAAGGGLYLDSGSGAKVTVTNSTFNLNSSGMGGAIFSGAGTVVRLLNDTISNNSSMSGSYGGAIAGISAGPQVQNTLFLGNSTGGAAGNCQGAGSFSVTSLGNNLSDGSSADCALSASGDLTRTNASVSPLQNNGGSTLTQALLPYSAAIGQGNAATCPAVDQRGYARLTYGVCDIGAYESP